MAQVHQQYEDNEHVKFLIGLSDLNQPYSCQDWGNVPNGGASQIIHDTSSQIWSLFESSGAVSYELNSTLSVVLKTGGTPSE